MVAPTIGVTGNWLREDESHAFTSCESRTETMSARSCQAEVLRRMECSDGLERGVRIRLDASESGETGLTCQ